MVSDLSLALGLKSLQSALHHSEFQHHLGRVGHWFGVQRGDRYAEQAHGPLHRHEPFKQADCHPFQLWAAFDEIGQRLAARNNLEVRKLDL